MAQHGSQQQPVIPVTVKTLDGHCLQVDVPASGTVKDIRTQLQQQHGLAKCALYLQVCAVPVGACMEWLLHTPQWH